MMPSIKNAESGQPLLFGGRNLAFGKRGADAVADLTRSDENGHIRRQLRSGCFGLFRNLRGKMLLHNGEL
jgi:hypothetical protein